MIFYYQLKNYFVKTQRVFLFLSSLSLFPPPTYLPIACILLVLFLYCACILLVSYLYRTCIVASHPTFTYFHLPLTIQTSPCIALVFFLYCTCIVGSTSHSDSFHLSNHFQPHLVLYLYCTCIVVSSLSFIYYLSSIPHVTLYCACIVPPTLSTPRIHHTSHIIHPTHLVLYLHCTCIVASTPPSDSFPST